MQVSRSRTGVVQVVQHMSPGGIETMALDLARALGGPIVSLGGTVEAQRNAWPMLDASGATLHALDQEHVRPWSLLARLTRLIKAERPRAVILHHIGPLLHGGLAARAAGVPVVVHIEHDAWHYENPRHRTIAKLCERLVRPRRIAVSDAVADGIRKVLPAARPLVVPPGIETDRFVLADRSVARAALGLSPGQPVIGTVGRLTEVKGHVHLVRALAELEGVTCVIVGDGPERSRLEGEAARLGVADRLRLLGLRSDPERVVPAFDVFCLPSHAEGLPRALLEAEACGVPVVASDVGGVRSALAPGGRAVPAGNPQAIVDAVRAVLAAPPDPHLSRNFVVERFSFAATLATLKSVIAESGR